MDGGGRIMYNKNIKNFTCIEPHSICFCVRTAKQRYPEKLFNIYYSYVKLIFTSSTSASASRQFVFFVFSPHKRWHAMVTFIRGQTLETLLHNPLSMLAILVTCLCFVVVVVVAMSCDMHKIYASPYGEIPKTAATAAALMQLNLVFVSKQSMVVVF